MSSAADTQQVSQSLYRKMESMFQAYASGCDVVILASDFERLQIIPGAKHGNIQVGCVDCSMHQGKIAASYGHVICIFEPIALLNQKTKASMQLNYQWQKSGQFALESVVHNLAWDPQGIRLLTGSNSLQLWSNGNQEANINDEETADETDPSKVGDWTCIWESKTASPIHLLTVSPDGEFFATVGKDDCLVKVWYNSSSWQSAIMAPATSMDKREGDIDFSFIYLAHPRAVTGFSWRKTSKYMPSRGLTCNVLLTCCKDNVCRLWAETLLPSDTLLSGEGHTQWSESVFSTNNLKRNASNREKLNIRSFRIGRRRSSGLIAHSGYLPHQQDAHEVHRNSPLHANSLCHFHIAASINPATDIPLLPSITSLSLSENEETNGPFVVHWLNNKELHFTLSMEVFLQQLRRNLEQQSPESVADDGQMAGKSDDEIDENSEYRKGFMQSVHSDRSNGEKTSSAVMIDHKIEMLLAEWNKNADMLFSIHPMDGSLLVWHVDWLDEYQPGMFRQVQVSFASRIPVAFPTGDANSLSKSIVMYACTKNVDLAIQQGKLKPPGMTHSTSGMLISAGQNKSSGSLKLSIFTPNVLMISKHADGSLNQWAVSFAEESAFSTVLGVSHKSRYCGHRFHLNDLACHSVLPLLLTTSYHNAIRTPDDGNLHNESRNFQTSQCHSSMSRNKRDIGTAAAFQDSNAIYSELILWRVDPVGPLSYSGGVSELARIHSLHVSAFSNVAWLPTLIPSYCLGAYCNSPSACFVASDGHYLRLYQAVIDAKKILSELSNPEIARFVGEVFNIVSQQSTARPGCIIELDAITELYGKETQLLHVFKEDFIFVHQPTKMQQKGRQTSTENSPQQEAEEPHDDFSEKFFLVVIEHKQNNRSVLHMWHLHLKSDPISVDHATETPLSPPEEQNCFTSEKLHSPFFKKYQACKANLQSASRLALNSKRVYSQELALPEGVEIIRATPSAGHLSSSSVHPACLAPYLLATSCSDGKVRFWRCQVSAHSASSAAGDSLESKFSCCWEEWPLLIEGGLVNSSAVSVPGRPVDVSCSYTSRLAVAYKQSKPVNEHSNKHFTMHVGIFECESTGGSQWILEQTIHLDDLSHAGAILDPRISIDSNLVIYNKQESHLTDHEMTFEAKPLVHLDWVSKEDGSHILTIGIGSKLLMYGQVSGMIQSQTKKEAPAVLSLSLWDNAKEVSQSRWVLLRSVDLVSSVDGSLSLPVSLSWVRDGILVVGMDCEMHVYSQWQPHDKLDPVITEAESGSTPSVVSLAKYGTANGSNPYLYKKNLTRSMTGLAQKFGGKKIAFQWNTEMEDSGLFEASHDLSPTLPQYHPLQLLELMDLGKIRRSKAILSHLVKCIAGEVITVNDAETSHERRLRSLTISASGSTARDPLTTNKGENPDYTEIDSIPPLPLCALLAADEDISHTTFEKSSKLPNSSKKICRQSTGSNYDELFATSNLSTDLLDSFSVGDDNEPKIIDLSQYSLTYFGPEHARVLSSHLLHSSLPGLTSMEQMFLMALADTVATISTDIGESRERTQGGETLDECGLRFLLAMRLHTFLLTSLPPVYRAQLLHQGLSTCHFAWAFHSEAEEELLNMIPAMQRGDPHWSELRAMGVGWWVRSTNILRRCIEKVAKAAFQRNNDPLEAAIFYLAMKKKAVLWGLFRSLQDKKMTEFFGKNFSDDRWRKAALKNAFALLGKQRFEQSAAFFLLAGSLKDAVEVCLERLHDVQLALVIARLYESEFEVSFTYKSILVRRILGYDIKSKDFNLSLRNSDSVLRSMAYWILEDYTNSLNTLLEEGMKENDNSSVTEHSKSTSCNPGVFNFYNYLRTHPLLLRRHFASSEKTMSQMGLTVESGLADKISLAERKLFFATANAHFKAGCPMLALEVLSKMPAVTMKPKNLQSETSSYLTVNFSSEESKRRVLDCDCSSSIVNGLGSKVPSDWLSHGQSTSSFSFDWSQSSLTFEEQPLELKWDSDKDDEEEEIGLSMKEINPSCSTTAKIEGESYCNFSSSADDFLNPSEDVIAAQLKFGACLKILTTELRTLSTGYEVDGGKLRFQLYKWLEREIIALQKTCNYNVDLEAIKDSFEVPDSEQAENGIVDQQKPLHQQEYLQRRRLWLLQNQPLLRMFLSYCSLHGSHGGGLASVRMELILLLQESQQEHSVKQVTSPFMQLASVPLLFACTASAKTVVANPRLHLSNLTQDIVHTIVEFDSPPHPDMRNNKIYVMHTVAASLSACLYQCLCDGHSYSSSYANQFTGMVYQSFLFAQQRSNRAASLDGTVTPNTSPEQWPGIKELIHLLNSAGDEDKPKLTVLLCEVLTAVYLSLFAHGLGTHSSNELFRLVAHPLNSKMWAAVFGGGAQQPLKNQVQPKPVTGRWLPEHSQQQIVMYSVDCVGFSKALATINSACSGSAAEVETIEELPDPELKLETSHVHISGAEIVEVTGEVEGGTPEEHHNRFKGTDSKATNREAPCHNSSFPVVSQDIPVCKEKFIPPELSIWDYFIAKPFLPTVQSKFEYDSEESQDSDDEEDAFASDTQLQEHSNPNSFSWSLMRYAMVQLVLHNLKKFYPMAGLDLSELPVCSPSCHAILKTLQRWEQVLLRRLELFGGPPQDFISMHATEGTVSSGPALLIHKALLEPTNTPFKSKHHTALPVKRLWQFLVKQEEVQEIFIRNIFTKKRCQNEVEADSGYPGGRARIVHKESDIITAFAINKANRNCVAIATSHDIQELDVSAILATQIYTWVEDEFELESKGSDEFLVVHARDDFGDLQCSTPYTPSVPGTPINMPWLGSMQTGRGASVMIKRNMNNARRMASHPTLPYYLTGAQDGSVRMFEWGHSHQLACFRPSGSSRITRIRFNHQGNKFGIVDGDGFLSFWQTSPIALGATPKPYLTWQCHNKTANDFVFVSSSTLIATAGQSTDNRNICLWDTLVPQTNSLVHAFTCHDSGATVLAYVSKQQLLVSGGRKGYVCIFDLRQRLLRQTFQAHDSPIKAIALDPAEEYFITGSAEGNMKVWSLSTHNLIHTFSNEHARQSLFRNIGTGVMQIETGPANHMFSCGADGTMKMRILPDRFSAGSGKLDIWQNDVRFIL
ncbi:dmX-like protein 1 isoform X5 [Stegostoma tigrinum]|uniref:dmX-like protein 1 isoform X5 n=1 Tax=Stegostoma tigrinum TaxID=3053191 RepID=UPI0028708AA1|nr:dmX-like protein 1 isoform X5 [Stegostoma tigrinum]